MKIIIWIAVTIVYSCVIVEMVMAAEICSAACIFNALPKSIPLRNRITNRIAIMIAAGEQIGMINFEGRVMSMNKDMRPGVVTGQLWVVKSSDTA